MNKISRRQFLTATGVLAAAGLLSGCGGSTGTAAAASSTANPAATSTLTDAVPRQTSCTSHRWNSSTALPPWYPRHVPTGTATSGCWRPIRRYGMW